MIAGAAGVLCGLILSDPGVLKDRSLLIQSPATVFRLAQCSRRMDSIHNAIPFITCNRHKSTQTADVTAGSCAALIGLRSETREVAARVECMVYYHRSGPYAFGGLSGHSPRVKQCHRRRRRTPAAHGFGRKRPRVSSMPGFEHVRLAVMSYKSFVPDSTFDPDPLYGLFPMREFASSTFQTLDRTERPVLLTRRSKTSRRRETYPSCALGPS